MTGIKSLQSAHRKQPCLCLGNGPSLTRWYPQLPLMAFDFVTIGTNYSWKPPEGTPLPEFRSQYHCLINNGLTQEHMAHEPPKWTKNLLLGKTNERFAKGRTDVVIVPQVGSETIWRDDLYRGTDAKFTGIMALQLASYFGCNPIYLLGYDAHQNESHHWGGPPPKRRSPASSARTFHIQDMHRAEKLLTSRGIAVFNANPDTAHTAFPHGEPA